MNGVHRVTAVTLLVLVAGCAGFVGSGPGGQLEATVVPSESFDVEPVPLSAVDDDRLRRVTERAVGAYESNGTAAFVVVSVPQRDLDETRERYERLTDRPDGESGRLVSYRGYTVWVRLLIYA
ncbi:hypothetical protein RYH80_11215 [Halobaculum sp. MBLA0147]|uniref:hypothetical protein n=1 Tax=Halobaculum sp. MBLA0147 TaxID=3079934 RepID=UPI003526492F